MLEVEHRPQANAEQWAFNLGFGKVRVKYDCEKSVVQTSKLRPSGNTSPPRDKREAVVQI